MPSEDSFKCSVAFKEIQGVLNKEGSKVVKKIKGTYAFKVKNASGQQAVWFVDCKTGNGAVKFDCKDKAECTITMSDADLLAMMAGTLDTTKAFMSGKLKIAGNMALAMKLKELQPSAKSKL